ncbi:MAG: MFS transporter [Treponema sp.]
MHSKTRAEAVFFVSSFFNSLVFFAPVAILVRTRCGITLSQFFILQALLSFGIFLFEVPCGMVTDKIGYRSSIIISQVLLCITRILFLVGGSFLLFIIEAVIEALSISFISGTTEAYRYDMYEQEEYMPKSAVVDNYSTAGFIASTLLFVPLNKWYGITGLIAATLAALCISLAVLLFLPKAVYSTSAQDNRTAPESQEGAAQPPLKSLLKSLFTKDVLFFFFITSFISIASLMVSFFYILLVTAHALSENWMSLIILGYAALQMLSPLIITKLQPLHRGNLFAAEIFLVAVLFLGLGFLPGYAVFIPMLLLPLVLSLLGYLLSDINNHLIDTLGQQKNRAGFLSVLNQGANLCEIFFLFFASAVGTQTVSSIFVITALGFFFLSLIAIWFRNANFFKIPL